MSVVAPPGVVGDPPATAVNRGDVRLTPSGSGVRPYRSHSAFPPAKRRIGNHRTEPDDPASGALIKSHSLAPRSNCVQTPLGPAALLQGVGAATRDGTCRNRVHRIRPAAAAFRIASARRPRVANTPLARRCRARGEAARPTGLPPRGLNRHGWIALAAVPAWREWTGGR